MQQGRDNHRRAATPSPTVLRPPRPPPYRPPPSEPFAELAPAGPLTGDTIRFRPLLVPAGAPRLRGSRRSAPELRPAPQEAAADPRSVPIAPPCGPRDLKLNALQQITRGQPGSERQVRGPSFRRRPRRLSKCLRSATTQTASRGRHPARPAQAPFRQDARPVVSRKKAGERGSRPVPPAANAPSLLRYTNVTISPYDCASS